MALARPACPISALHDLVLTAPFIFTIFASAGEKAALLLANASDLITEKDDDDDDDDDNDDDDDVDVSSRLSLNLSQQSGKRNFSQKT